VGVAKNILYDISLRRFFCGDEGEMCKHRPAFVIVRPTALKINTREAVHVEGNIEENLRNHSCHGTAVSIT
jgi:hypothetical protein